MRSRALAVAVMLVAAACSDSSDNGEDLTTNRIAEPGDVSALPDGTRVVTQGVLIISDDTASGAEDAVVAAPVEVIQN